MSGLTMNDLIVVYFALSAARLILDAPKVVWILRLLSGREQPKYGEMSDKKAGLVKLVIKDGRKMLGDMERDGLTANGAGGVMALSATLFVFIRSVAWPYFLARQIKRKIAGSEIGK